MSYDTIKIKMLQLSTAERLNLLKVLADSLVGVSNEDNFSEEYVETLNRRAEEMRTGTGKSAPMQDVIQKMKQKHGLSN